MVHAANSIFINKRDSRQLINSRKEEQEWCCCEITFAKPKPTSQPTASEPEDEEEREASVPSDAPTISDESDRTKSEALSALSLRPRNEKFQDRDRNSGMQSVTPQNLRNVTVMEVEGQTSNDSQSDNMLDRLDRVRRRCGEEKYATGPHFANVEFTKDAQPHPSGSKIAAIQFVHGDLTNAVIYSSKYTTQAESIRESKVIDRDKETEIRSWKTPPNTGPQQAPPWRKKRPRKKPGKASKTQKGDKGEIILSWGNIREHLPRWIPSEVGHPVLLFTRHQFIKGVIGKAEKRISRLGPEHQEWLATLSDHNPEEPQSYLLEASGSGEVLEILSDMTEKFVRGQIERANLDILLEDGASQVVTVKCLVDMRNKTPQKALGVSFSSAKKSKTEGVLIKSVKPKGVLAKAVGNVDVIEKGCALLAVNNSKVSNLSEIEEQLMQFKHQFPNIRTSIQVELSLCLSKFADLSSSSCNIPACKIHRRDGEPYEKEQYMAFQLQKCMEWSNKSKMEGKPVFEEDEEEDGTSSADDTTKFLPESAQDTAKDCVPTMKRPSLLSCTAASAGIEAISSSAKAMTGPAVPRKKRAHEQNSKMNVKKPKLLSGLISSMRSREAIFEATFKSSIGLGGYFKTRRNQCHVFSIFLKGQMANEPRITNGCIVISINTGEGPVAILSHSELQKQYVDAKRKGSNIKISFRNQGLTGNNNDNRMNNICWNESGDWVGTQNLDEDDGWAGGAKNAPKPKVAKTTAEIFENASKNAPMHPSLNMLTSKTTGKTTKAVKNPATAVLETIQNGMIEEWTRIVNTEKPGHKTREPSKSLLVGKSSFPPEEAKEEKGLTKLLHPSMKRSRRERTHSKKIKISIQNNEEIYFCKDDAPNMRRILQIKKESKAKQMFGLRDPENDLINAFQKKTCTDVLEILESQDFLFAISQGSFDFQAILRKQYSFISKELEIMKESFNYSLKPEERDLRAKSKVLDIYMNCVHLIEVTLALKKWYALSIELNCIDLQHKSSIVDKVGGSIVVKLDAGNLNEDFGSLPTKNFTQHISYVNDNLKYLTYNNKNIASEKRSFVIDLKTRSNSFASDRMLGTFDIALNDIEDKCFADENPTEFTASISNSKWHELVSGHVTLNVNKKSADKNYIMNKKKEIIAKLKLQMKSIDRFNNDPNTPSGARLTANILCEGGKSLLHAALVLMDDTDLVRTMLKLGANPRSNFHSGLVTPLSLAQRNLHSALDKERHMRLKKFNTEKQVLRCNQARALVEMLQENVIASPTATATLADPSLESRQKSSGERMQEGNHSQSSDERLSISATDENQNPQETGARSAPKISSKKHREPPPSVTSPSSSAQSTPDVEILESPPRSAPKSSSKKHWEPPPSIRSPSSSAQSTLDVEILESPPRSAPKSSSKKHWEPPPSVTSPSSSAQSTLDVEILESPQLPKIDAIDPRVWASKRPSMHAVSFCIMGPNCPLFKKGSCRYFHNACSPLILNERRTQLPTPSTKPDTELPDFSKKEVEFHRQSGPDGKEWWTAAYLVRESKTLVYVQKVLDNSGLVGENGVVWFPSQDAALFSLRWTVHLFEQSKTKRSHSLQHQQDRQKLHKHKP